MSDLFDDIVRSWRPEPVTVIRRIDDGPLTCFADLLDVPATFAANAEVPLMWHWFSFAPRFPQSLLAADGHPRSGALMPEFPERKRMMAGGRIEQATPLRVGAEYARRSEVGSLSAKDGRTGRMLFVTVRHTYSTCDGKQVAVEEEDVVYRQQSPGQPRRLLAQREVSSPWDRSAGQDGRLDTTTDSRFLFRFSALTYNTHRIHYDEPYATETEGYPALVVHGPLLALLMLELIRRPGKWSPNFEYRLQAPAFCGERIRAVRDGATLRVGSANVANASASGTAECRPDAG